LIFHRHAERTLFRNAVSDWQPTMISAGVCTYLNKTGNVEEIVKACETSRSFFVEEHTIRGGLGGGSTEILAEHCPKTGGQDRNRGPLGEIRLERVLVDH